MAHGVQHTRLPCPSLSPRVCSDSCSLSQWCYQTISSPSSPFCSCFQSFPASGSFPVSWLLRQVANDFSISPSNEYSGLISFRVDWFDILEAQGTLKSLLQPHNWKASILWNSAFFTVQLSHLYMTIGKAIGLTSQTFVCKVMSLLFSTLPHYYFDPNSSVILLLSFLRQCLKWSVSQILSWVLSFNSTYILCFDCHWKWLPSQLLQDFSSPALNLYSWKHAAHIHPDISPSISLSVWPQQVEATRDDLARIYPLSTRYLSQLHQRNRITHLHCEPCTFF